MQFPNARPLRLPRVKPNVWGEETVLREALGAGAAVGPRASFHRSVLNAANDPPASLSTTGTIPGARILTSRDWTLAEGLTAGAGAGTAAAVSGGVYVWFHLPHAEVGLFGSISIGFVVNVGFGGGGMIMLLFGPAPSVLAGDSITVSVDVGVDVLTFSGMLIISAPPGGLLPSPSSPPSGWVPEIIGVGIAITAGWSTLPADISVMPGRTWTRPIGSI